MEILYPGRNHLNVPSYIGGNHINVLFGRDCGGPSKWAPDFGEMLQRAN